MSTSQPDQSALKARAYAAADRELLPDQIEARMADVKYWRAKQAFWADKQTEARTAAKPPVWADTADRKHAEVTGILELMELDVRQMNSRLA